MCIAISVCADASLLSNVSDSRVLDAFSFAPKLLVGDHLQQEQRGGVTAGAAVLPAAGPAVPRLSVGRLQVRLGVPWLFERTQPRMGRHQVRGTPTLWCLPTDFFKRFF